MPAPTPSNTLVIVESPTKARTITKYLPKDFLVKASVGHVRDLPNSAAEIPAKYKKQKWARLGVNVEDGFAPLYVVPKGKKPLVTELRAAVRKADHIYFATDEDREGESISWHLLQLVGSKVPHQRLVFHEITKSAISKALETPREIDQDLVRAQETRRVVDRLFGYEVSPLLWKKMAPRLSAGRVQSVAVRLLVERERARIRFTPAGFWSLKAQFACHGSSFEADLVEVSGRRIAVAKDFDPDTGKLRSRTRRASKGVVILEVEQARGLEAALRTGVAPATVASVKETPYSTAPQPPYVTSTLQQEANSRLRFAARHTMAVAQQLYENGFITYMRTDSTMLSDEAKAAARDQIVERYGEAFLSPIVRVYKTKVKNAQEAHEAIRPAGRQFQSVAKVRAKLGPEAARLYDLILRRTLASQMGNAKGTSTVALVDVAGAGTEARFRAAGRTIEFPGFLKAFEGGSGAAAAKGGKGRLAILPKLAPGDRPAVESAAAKERLTRAPQRFTEGTLIRKLEQLGIGRPSTWASVVDLVQARSYAFRKGGKLIPTFTAMAVVGLLEEHFEQLMDYEFTAQLEDQLDAISRGELDRQQYLRRFYFGEGGPCQGEPSEGGEGLDGQCRGLRQLIDLGLEQIDPRKVCSLPVGSVDGGSEVEVRIGRYGPFLSDGESRCSVPQDVAPDELDLSKAAELLEIAKKGVEPLGHDPESGDPVYLLRGRFGPFVQLGESKGGGKVKRSSLLRGMDARKVTLEVALQLLAMPRPLGLHPESGDEVLVANGRYGPYVKCGKESRSVPSAVSPFEITLAQALELLAKAKGGRGRRVREPLKVLGAHPETGKELKVLAGRYGPYVTDGKLNASLPRDAQPEDTTMEAAVALLKARAQRVKASPARKKPARRAPAKRKSA